MPIVGIAPIMVMWFGFDWQSKAAVVVVMTFFPMLVNTWPGCAAGAMERDLMRSYAAGYWQTLLKLRLPAALPFIFNALKINSTLALIGAIVAEFFGTPIVGMGFRISTEVGADERRHGVGDDRRRGARRSASTGLALDRAGSTFWHPSYRNVTSDRRTATGATEEMRNDMRRLAAGTRDVALGAGALASAQAADKLTLQLKWVTQAQFAGYYVAKDKGFYKDAGLDVRSSRAARTSNPAQVIAGGGADVIVDWMPSALATREKGVPLVNIAQTFKHSGMS